MTQAVRFGRIAAPFAFADFVRQNLGTSRVGAFLI
jgi:hypothetical protein